MTLTPAAIALAAALDPGEADEPPLCPCDRGYIGHADSADDAAGYPGHRCEYHPGTVDRLDFRTSAPQLFRDGWRRVSRWCDYTGSCVVCGRRCYAFRDGENDPRGPLGDHADSGLVADEYDDIRTGAPFLSSLPDVPACFPCMNEEPRYRVAVDAAVTRWRRLAPVL